MDEELINKLRDEISFLRARVAKLEEENALLKAALTGQVVEAEKKYADLIEEFDKVAKLIYKTIVYLVKVYKRPVTYDEIIRCFRARYSFIDVKTETITRRIRELKEQGFLRSPKQGYFIPLLSEESEENK